MRQVKNKVAVRFVTYHSASLHTIKIVLEKPNLNRLTTAPDFYLPWQYTIIFVSKSVNMPIIVFIDPYPIVGVGFSELLKSDRPEIQSRALSSKNNLTPLIDEFTPDLLILTVNSIKKRNSLPTLEVCRKLYPQIPIVLYDEGHNKSRMVKWMKSGAAGYLFKREPESVLLQCIDTILSGRKYLSPEGWNIFFSLKTINKVPSTKKHR